MESLIRLGTPPHLYDDATPSDTGLHVVPASDLDGDGKGDLLGYAVETTDDWLLRISAVRGFDGKVLWTRTENYFYSFAVPAKVGPDGRDGVLIVSYDILGAIVVGEFSLDLIALYGDGTEAWNRTLTGHLVDGLAAVVGRDLPLATGLLQAGGGPGDEVLIGLEDVVATSDGFTAEVEAQVLDGADGSPGGASSFQAVDREPFPLPGPDLSGDGLDDYVFTSVSAGESAGDLAARASADGRALWERRGVPLTYYSSIGGSGDTTADGREDLVIENCWILCEEDEPGLVLFSGVDGKTLWKRPAPILLSFWKPLGDLTGDARAEVGTVELFADPNEGVWAVGMRYEALDGTGARAYSVSYAVSYSAEDDVIVLSNFWPDEGDVEPDGIPDAAHELVVVNVEQETFTKDRGLVSGATGEKVWTGRIGVPLFGSVDGSGDDLARITFPSYTEIGMSAVDGLTAGPLWGSVVASAGFLADVVAADLDGDGFGEVVVNMVTFDFDTFDEFWQPLVLRGSDGALLWTLSPSPVFRTVRGLPLRLWPGEGDIQ